MKNIFYSSSKEKTRILGKILSKQLLPGDIIFLVGDLGAGKSEFVRGIAEGLIIKDPIPSPSFIILNVYNNGTIPLNHFDWYRIGSDEELFEIGTDDFLFSDSISCIEWPSMSDYYFKTLKVLRINIRNSIDYSDSRQIIIDDSNFTRNINLEEIHNEYTSI